MRRGPTRTGSPSTVGRSYRFSPTTGQSYSINIVFVSGIIGSGFTVGLVAENVQILVTYPV